MRKPHPTWPQTPEPCDVMAWGEHEHERRDGMLIALHLVKEDARCSRSSSQPPLSSAGKEKIDMMHHHDANITSVLHPPSKEGGTDDDPYFKSPRSGQEHQEEEGESGCELLFQIGPA